MSLFAFLLATLLGHIGFGGLVASAHPAAALPSHSSHTARPMDSGGGMPFTQAAPPVQVSPTDSGGGMPFH
jgi:hypothetical protein